MNLPTREQAGVLIVSVSGRIDHTASEEFTLALEPLLARCAKGQPALLLDFSAVDYISSAGLRVLLIAAKRSKASGGKVVLSGMRPEIREVFDISGFSAIFQILPGRDEAIAAFA